MRFIFDAEISSLELHGRISEFTQSQMWLTAGCSSVNAYLSIHFKDLARGATSPSCGTHCGPGQGLSSQRIHPYFCALVVGFLLGLLDT